MRPPQPTIFSFQKRPLHASATQARLAKLSSCGKPFGALGPLGGVRGGLGPRGGWGGGALETLETARNSWLLSGLSGGWAWIWLRAGSKCSKLFLWLSGEVLETGRGLGGRRVGARNARNCSKFLAAFGPEGRGGQRTPRLPPAKPR